MSKSNSARVAVKPSEETSVAAAFAAAKPVETTEETKVLPVVEPNDPFAVYSDVDVDALQDAAIDAYKQGERNARREGQMQIANILARYHQELLLGDADPSKWYKVAGDGSHTELFYQNSVTQAIARIVYGVPAKTMDGKNNPLPRALEMRIRLIAPIVFYAITERVPLVWSDENDALMVPAWFAVTDPTMVAVFNTNRDARLTATKPVPLDGREGRTVANLLKRVGDPAKKSRAPQPAGSNAQKTFDALKSHVANNGLAKTLAVVADMFAAKDDKPFADEVIELLTICVEHARTRNGADVLSEAFKEKPAKRTTKQAA